jgi:hypothetical protein
LIICFGFFRKKAKKSVKKKVSMSLKVRMKMKEMLLLLEEMRRNLRRYLICDIGCCF